MLIFKKLVKLNLYATNFDSRLKQKTMLDKVILLIIALLIILTVYIGIDNNYQKIRTSLISPDNNWLKAELVPESPFPLQAKAGIVIDRQTNQILYQRNVDLQLPIASLTKLMTALVVDYDQDLFNKMLIASDNQAAEKLAKEDTISKMNQKAKELGMDNTYFVDTTGLGPGNVSTANELVLLTEEILKHPDLIKILGTKKYQNFENTNKLLALPTVIAGKTGFTDEAGECLMLVTDKYISIVLNAEDRFEQSEKLIKILDNQ